MKKIDTGLIGTAVLHILLLILLLVIAIRRPQAQEEGGVPVMLGNTELSQGNADPYTLTDVDIMNEPEVPAPDVSEPEMGFSRRNKRGKSSRKQKRKR